MAGNFQSSFIPKASAMEQPFARKKTSILGTFALYIFIFSIAAAVGLFAYKAMVRKQIQNLQAELAEAEKGIDKQTISEMAAFGKKLEAAKTLVARHRAISAFLGALSSSTVSAVQFTEFGYDEVAGGQLKVSLKGKAGSYGTIALQENILSKDERFKSMEFSDLSLSDKGNVSFDLDLTIDPRLSSYSP